ITANYPSIVTCPSRPTKRSRSRSWHGLPGRANFRCRVTQNAYGTFKCGTAWAASPCHDLAAVNGYNEATRARIRKMGRGDGRQQVASRKFLDGRKTVARLSESCRFQIAAWSATHVRSRILTGPNRKTTAYEKRLAGYLTPARG